VGLCFVVGVRGGRIAVGESLPLICVLGPRANGLLCVLNVTGARTKASIDTMCRGATTTDGDQ
jgi:hypothetical protein